MKGEMIVVRRSGGQWPKAHRDFIASRIYEGVLTVETPTGTFGYAPGEWTRYEVRAMPEVTA